MKSGHSQDTAFVGLRSGGVLTVTRAGAAVKVDASQVKLEDIAWGVAGQSRFAGQLHHPYTVAEHSVLGSYLTGSPQAGLQFLFHDAAEAFGVCDLNSKVKELWGAKLRPVERAVEEALCGRFGVYFPFQSEVKEIDRWLGRYELLRLHPARDKVLAGYGEDSQEILAAPDHRQSNILAAWFGRPRLTVEKAAQAWLARLATLRHALHDATLLEEKLYPALLEAKLPYPEKLLAPFLASRIKVGAAEVQAELEKLERKGELTRHKGYYHMTPKGKLSE